MTNNIKEQIGRLVMRKGKSEFSTIQEALSIIKQQQETIEALESTMFLAQIEEVRKLRAENKKLKEDKKQIFQALEKELRLHEVLNCERRIKDNDKMSQIVDKSVRLRLVSVRNKLETFKAKYD